MSRRPTGDDGSVLLLVIGFTAVLLLMVGLVVNVSAVVLAKRAVVASADGAAVSAAQALDTGVLYAGGLGGRLPLNRSAVVARVEDYQARAASAQPGLDLVGGVADDGTTAVVRAARRVRLPFGVPGIARDQVVTSEARARSPVAP